MTNRRFPAEWEPQDATLLTWPDTQGNSIWKESAATIQESYLKLIALIITHQKVYLMVRNEKQQATIKKHFENNSNKTNLNFLICDSNDIWIRDYGPISFFNNKQIEWLNFSFNSWGEKYPFELDDKITLQLWERFFSNHFSFNQSPLILEGGSIETDGCGTLLTTRSCLLTHNRNSNLSDEALITSLKELLGITRLLILDHGKLIGDDTDGHIDTLVRFCDPHTLCYSLCNDETDPHFQNLKKMEEQLKTFKDYEGQAYHLIPLPLPKAIFDKEGQRLPANYANFLITNDCVFVPTYDDPADDIAAQRLAHCFPTRKIISFSSMEFIKNFGSLHCASMQVPK